MIIKGEHFKSDRTSFGYPNQFTKMKTKLSKEDIKSNLDYFSGLAQSQYIKNKKYVKDYKLFNGEFDFSDYQEIPEAMEIMNYLTDSPLLEQQIPQYLKHYSILNTPINTQLGELTKRTPKHMVKAVDEFAETEQIDFRSNLLREHIINQIKQKTQNPEEIEQLTEQELASKVTSYTSVAERWGNKVLTSLKYRFDFHEKSFMGFSDLLKIGQEFHHIYPNNTAIGFNYITESPRHVWYCANKEAAYTTDCWAIGTFKVMSTPEILETFKLEGDEIDHLNSLINGTFRNGEYSAYSPTMPALNDPLWSLSFDLDEDALDTGSLAAQNSHTVLVAYWQSHRPIYKRTYLDENGYQQNDLVSEDYKLDKEAGDVSLEQTWENIWMKGIRIGSDIYYVEPLEMASPPIVGLINTSRATQGKSPLQLMKPFQAIYNLAVNQVWELLEKEIGVIFLGDERGIPQDDSANPIDQFFLAARDRGAALVNTSADNVQGSMNFNQWGAADLSRSNEIMSRVKLAEWAEAQALKLVGITPQRTGSVLATETATGTNTALTQSYAQTEPWFAFHDRVMRMVYQTLLDTAQYIELQKPYSTLNYLNTDMENEFLKITQDELLRDLHVYVSYYAEDREVLDHLKQLTQAAMQNGADLQDVADILTANSERSLRTTLDELRKRTDKQRQEANFIEQQKIEATNKQFELQAQLEAALEDKKMAHESQENQLDRENDIKLKVLDAIGNEGSYDQEGDTLGLLTEQSKIFLEQSKHNFEKKAKTKELSQKDEELRLKEKDIDTKLKIAKENKTKAEMQRKKK